MDPALPERELIEAADGLEIIALRALGNTEDARDAVQETLARAIEVLRTRGIPDSYTLDAFLYGIVRHVIADQVRLRRRVGRGGRAPEHLTAPLPSALEQLVNREEREAVARGLAQLPAADRRLLTRCFVHGERPGQIAVRLGQPAERIRKQKSRALERLRAVLAPAWAPLRHELEPRTIPSTWSS